MSSHNVLPTSETDVCARVKRLGYAESKNIRLYGEEYLAVSDPFLDGDGVSLRVTTRLHPSVQTLRLPSTILQHVRGRIPSAGSSAIAVDATRRGQTPSPLPS